MLKSLFLTLSFWFVLSVNGQVIDKKIDDFLKQIKADTVMTYSYSCYRSFYLDSCSYEATRYLLWKQNGSYFIKRFDYCHDFKPIILEAENPFSFYLINKITIDKEKIKEPTYYEIKKSKNKIDTLLVTSTIDHSCNHHLMTQINKISKTKYVDIYDLEFQKFDNGKKNIYFNHNQNTKLKNLLDRLTTFIEDLINDSKFKFE
jgi:hypothetical protein